MINASVLIDSQRTVPSRRRRRQARLLALVRGRFLPPPGLNPNRWGRGKQCFMYPLRSGCTVQSSCPVVRFARTTDSTKGKNSPYSITERRVPELIPVLGSQPAGDVKS